MRKKLCKVLAMTALSVMMAVTSVFVSTDVQAAEKTAGGDANVDGKIDLNDAKVVLKAALGITSITNEQGKINADINKDGKIDLNDAKSILKAALGIVDYSLTYKYSASSENGKIYYNMDVTDKDIVCVVFNPMSKTLSVNAYARFYKNGVLIEGSTINDFNYAFQSKKESVFDFNLPKDSEGNKIEYDKVELEFNIEEAFSSVITDVDAITYQFNKKPEELVGTFTNNSKYKKLEFVNVKVLYYDEAGKLYDIREIYVYCNESGSVAEENFYFEYVEETASWKVPASYKVYVNYAMSFDNN